MRAEQGGRNRRQRKEWACTISEQLKESSTKRCREVNVCQYRKGAAGFCDWSIKGNARDPEESRFLMASRHQQMEEKHECWALAVPDINKSEGQ